MRRALFLFAFLVAAAHPSPAISLRVTHEASIADHVIAREVRWASPTEVYVGFGKNGVIKAAVENPAQRVFVMPPADQGGFVVSGRLAAGRDHIVVASPIGGIGWIPLDVSKPRKLTEKGLLSVMDVDAQGDQVVILGADSGSVQGLDRAGTIAWTGSLSKGLSDLRPLMKGRATPGGKDMARCSFLETGAVRWMPDDSVVILPGTEPGLYRYSKAGRLQHVWDTGPLGIVDDCDIAQDELSLLARDFAKRVEWMSARVIVDDLLSLDNAPALLLRHVENGVTRWDLVTIPARGKGERIALPVTMPTPRAHLRGDVLGDRIVFLVFEDPLPGQEAIATPRIVVMAIVR